VLASAGPPDAELKASTTPYTMKYQLRRQGFDLGIFSLEELRQRRAAGELTGAE
jgi:hypothetical protein